MAQLRNRDTGRYIHDWGVIGQRINEQGYREVAICSHCGKVRASGAGMPDRTYRNEATAEKAGEPLAIPSEADKMAEAMRYDPERQRRTGYAGNS